MGSTTWGSITSKDTAGNAAATRPPVSESNGRTMSRRPTRILAGPPPWVQRRPEA